MNLITRHKLTLYCILFSITILPETKGEYYDIRGAELYFNVAVVKDKDASDELLEMFNKLNSDIEQENLKIETRINSLKVRDFVGKKKTTIMQHLKDNKFYLCRTSRGYVYTMTFLSPQTIADGSYVYAYTRETDDFYEYKTVLGANKRVTKYVEIPDSEISAINIRRRSEEREENPELYTLKKKLTKEMFVENLKKGETYEGSSKVPIRCTATNCRGGVVMYKDFRRKCKLCVSGKVSKTIKAVMVWNKRKGTLKWINRIGSSDSFRNIHFLLD